MEVVNFGTGTKGESADKVARERDSAILLTRELDSAAEGISGGA